MAGTGEGQPADGQLDAITPLAVALADDQARLRLPPCDICGESLNRKSCAVVDLAAAARRAARIRTWRRDGSPEPRPALVSWQLMHKPCEVDRDWSLSFVIGVDSLRTDRQLLRQTLRVSSKPWYRQTDWPGLVVRILAGH